jgi:hypothetical protein
MPANLNVNQHRTMQKMQFLKKLIPPRLELKRTQDCDVQGFNLADSLEDGNFVCSHSDPFASVPADCVYIVRKVQDSNTWLILDRETMSFSMRAVLELEFNGSFTSSFDSSIVCLRGAPGRMRVGIYLSPSPGAETVDDPVAVMISDDKRINWNGYKVTCEACRYKKRRSSFKEGCDAGAERDGSSPCSFYAPFDKDDFSDICSVIPSSQEFLRMSHIRMLISDCLLTKMKIKVPAGGTDWCPIAHPMKDMTNQADPSPVQYESKLPRFNEKMKALTLEFKERTVVPSRRNLQIINRENRQLVFQFYRTGKDEYFLEQSKNGLSIAQAFCVVISSTLWH